MEVWRRDEPKWIFTSLPVPRKKSNKSSNNSWSSKVQSLLWIGVYRKVHPLSDRTLLAREGEWAIWSLPACFLMSNVIHSKKQRSWCNNIVSLKIKNTPELRIKANAEAREAGIEFLFFRSMISLMWWHVQKGDESLLTGLEVTKKPSTEYNFRDHLGMFFLQEIMKYMSKIIRKRPENNRHMHKQDNYMQKPILSNPKLKRSKRI